MYLMLVYIGRRYSNPRLVAMGENYICAESTPDTGTLLDLNQGLLQPLSNAQILASCLPKLSYSPC